MSQIIAELCIGLEVERIPLVNMYYRDGGGDPYNKYNNKNLYANNEGPRPESISESDATGDRDIQEIY